MCIERYLDDLWTPHGRKLQTFNEIKAKYGMKTNTFYMQIRSQLSTFLWENMTIPKLTEKELLLQTIIGKIVFIKCWTIVILTDGVPFKGTGRWTYLYPWTLSGILSGRSVSKFQNQLRTKWSIINLYFWEIVTQSLRKIIGCTVQCDSLMCLPNYTVEGAWHKHSKLILTTGYIPAFPWFVTQCDLISRTKTFF